MTNQPLDPDSTEPDRIRTAVRERYAAATSSGSGCCAPSTGCCGAANPDQIAEALGYAADATTSVPAGSNLGLGCGNPTGIASLRAGETVLDLGSGAGFDAFLAARAVGPTGRVLGVDMTPEMLQTARANLARSRFRNVEFRLGEIENLPVADRSVDVILSNCVINLSPDKARVFAEAFRVLKPGGRVAISDIVALRPLPAAMRADLELHTGCVAGAATVAEVEAMLVAAGFTDVHVEPKGELQQVVDGWFPGRGVEGYVASANIRATKP
ncbi:MAG TPA: arsenite methyltransferase [Planctomycetota bacterium]|nr:arsenite methyltransferase [Planctomycetota bacterium]